MVKALNLALLQEMERDPDVLILGEDVGVDGGVFRVTDDLQRKFGSQRVIDSPLAEAAIIGTAVGMALYGLKPVCEIQFSGFAFQCFHQIENHAARYRMRSQGRFHCQMVIRMPYGGGVRALEHHTESEEQFYAHVPGLKMVIPSGPRTARALLTSAIRDPDPVIFFESKALYHAAKEEIPEESETLPIGRAQVVTRWTMPMFPCWIATSWLTFAITSSVSFFKVLICSRARPRVKTSSCRCFTALIA